MTNTKEQKNAKTEKPNNVFTQIKQTSKRGRGLSDPLTFNLSRDNLNKKEDSEAVRVRIARTARIGTYITEEASDMLDDIIIKLKKINRKKPKIGEVIELALKELHKKTKQR